MVPFDDMLESLWKARLNEIVKYTPIHNHLRSLVKVASIEAIVLGSLGSWNAANDTGFRNLGQVQNREAFSSSLIAGFRTPIT
ncbi:hypothetical protein CEXT_623481 [Caerostris extrusa]|uniref:Transposase n=1 Tax=Caerostris extrusa TaxID=172846 RepID=A0AAV4W7X0_CAEEX|nr:hypothetical protein CEXT_623481 [Caerostris extrusa]